MIVINGTTSSPNTWVYKLEVTETATDPVAKTSTIKVEHFLGRHTGQSTSWFGGTLTFKTTITGYTAKTTTKYVNSGDLAPGKWKSLGSHSIVVSNTGTTSNPTVITIKGTHSTSEFTPASANATGTMNLTVLHQSPEPIINSVVENNIILSNLGITDEIVSRLSDKTFNMGATTYDEATVAQYGIFHTDKNVTSSTSTVRWTLNGVETADGGITAYAKDSQDGEGYLEYLYNLIPYEYPQIVTASVERKTDAQTSLTDNKAKISVNGTFYKGNDDVGDANTITLKYKIWEVNQTEPSSFTTISSGVTVSGGTFTLSNYEITNVNYLKRYNVKLQITDYFGSSETISTTLSTGRPVWTEYPDHVDFIKVTQNKKDIPDVDDLFYKPGDVEEITGNLVLGAYITSSAAELNFTIMTPKRLDNITSITMNSINISCRGDSGYLNSESGYHEFVGRSGYTITVSKSNENSITIAIRSSSAWTNVTNNTPCAVNGNFNFTLN